jgi:hypothetical protein
MTQISTLKKGQQFSHPDYSGSLLIKVDNDDVAGQLDEDDGVSATIIVGMVFYTQGPGDIVWFDNEEEVEIVE